MNILEIIKNPIFILSIIIIIGIIIYFIVSRTLPNTRTICKENQEIIGGQCVAKCDFRCPQKTGACYSPTSTVCIDNKTLCSTDGYCGLADATSGTFNGQCCDSKESGKRLLCSHRNIVFTKPITFNIIYRGKIYPITIKDGNYTLDNISDTNNYFTVIKNTINMNSDIKGLFNVESSLPITLKSSQFKIKYSLINKSDSSDLVIDFKNTEQLNNFGFDKKEYNFENDKTCTSPNNIDIYQCIEMPCETGTKFWDGKCCPTDKCTTDGTCCDGTDGKGNNICTSSGKTSCCTKPCCEGNTLCCDSSNNESCVEDKCKIKCSNNDKNNQPVYCDVRTNKETCENIEVVNPDGTVNDKKYSFCASDKCKFDGGGNQYEPPNIDHLPGQTTQRVACGYSGNFDKDNKYATGKPVVWCRTSNNLNPQDLNRYVNASISANFSECTQLNCENRINDISIDNKNISLLEDNNKLIACSGSYLCDTLLPICPSESITPSFININYPINYCLDQNNNITGELCPDGYIAEYHPRSKECRCVKKYNK